MWWQDAVVYQVYPRSYQDSDGDGVGDLRGINARLDHLAWLGERAIWLRPATLAADAERERGALVSSEPLGLRRPPLLRHPPEPRNATQVPRAGRRGRRTRHRCAHGSR